MQSETIELVGGLPGTRRSFLVLRFGSRGASPKVYIQAALHADEVPAILVAQELARQLTHLEASGNVRGEIVVVPFANPIGMDQNLLGRHEGRFDLGDGGNFNRGYPDLANECVEALRKQLTQNEQSNTKLIRHALRDAVAGQVTITATQDLKKQLLMLAIDADIVLDLHCDYDAVMHLYAFTPQLAVAEQLGAALGAQALLFATESGDGPFDEACSRPWQQLQHKLPQFPIALACFATTVELRGETDTSHALAQQDALGLCAFLAHQGALAPTAQALPDVKCKSTPLAGSEPITAPHAGVVVFHRAVGERVAAGDLIADVVDPTTGMATPLRCQSDGLLYARCGSRWATPGKRLAKIAGTSLVLTGKLLSP